MVSAGLSAGHDYGLLVEGDKDLADEPGAHAGCVLDHDRGEFAACPPCGFRPVHRSGKGPRAPPDGRCGGPRTRSSAGWMEVSRPRIRLLTRVASPARSSSNPTRTSSSARGPRRRYRRGAGSAGMVRAASAMMNASRASVFACPGYRSAMRRIASPGQVADVVAAGTGHGDRQGADRVGLVDDDQHRSVGGQAVEDRPQLRFVVGQRLVVDLLSGGGQSDGVVLTFAGRRCRNTPHSSSPFRSSLVSRSGRSPIRHRRPAPTLQRDLPKTSVGRVPISGPSTPPHPRRHHPPDHARDRGKESYRVWRP